RRVERQGAAYEINAFSDQALLAARARIAIESIRGGAVRHRACSQAPLAQHLVALRAPELAIIDALPALEPRPAAREMDSLRSALRWLLVPAFEPVPFDRQRTDVPLVHPSHPMQKGAALAVDALRREAAHRRIIAVEQHQRGPVLARIDRLRGAVH